MKKNKILIFVALFHFLTVYSQQAEYHLNPNLNYYCEMEEDTLWSMSPFGLIKRNQDGELLKWYHRGNTTNLYSNVFRAAVRDNQGVLWFGTDEGVIKFDGKTWTQQTGVDSSNTFNIAKDSKGKIWAATEKALYAYNGTTWQKFVNPNSTSGYKRSIAFDKNNNVLIGDALVLYSFDGKIFTKQTGYTSGNIYKILKDKDGNIWIANSVGISMFDGINWKKYAKSDFGLGTKSQIVRNIFFDSSNILWAVTSEELIKFENGKWVFVKKHNQLAFSSAYDSKRNKVWIGGSTPEITSYDILLGKLSSKKTNNSYGAGALTHITPIDDEVAIICNETWLSIYKNGVWSNYSNPFDSTQNWTVYSIRKNPIKNELLISTSVGVFSYSKNTGLQQKLTQVFENIQLENDGTIWGYKGAKIFKLSQSILVDKTSELFGVVPSNLSIYNIYLSKKGELWCATNNGLFNFTTKKNYNVASGASYLDNFFPILEQSNGKVWTGTFGGSEDKNELILIDAEGKVEKKLTDIPNLNSKYYGSRFVFEDESKNIWTQSINGLIKLVGSNWKLFNRKNTPYLLSDNASGMCEDSKGNIWITQFEGITVIKKSTILSGDIAVEANNPINFVLYPNPSTNETVISIDDKNLGSTILITNMQGQEIISQKLTNRCTIINTSLWSKGSYFVTLKGGNSFFTKQLIIQ
jgi:ligand-binding sensor domain-containing protein